MYLKKSEIENLISQILSDEERFDITVDHDFQLRKCLRKRHIKRLNKILKENSCYQIISCVHSIPYGDIYTKRPYFVYTENNLESIYEPNTEEYEKERI